MNKKSIFLTISCLLLSLVSCASKSSENTHNNGQKNECEIEFKQYEIKKNEKWFDFSPIDSDKLGLFRNLYKNKYSLKNAYNLAFYGEYDGFYLMSFDDNEVFSFEGYRLFKFEEKEFKFFKKLPSIFIKNSEEIYDLEEGIEKGIIDSQIFEQMVTEYNNGFIREENYQSATKKSKIKSNACENDYNRVYYYGKPYYLEINESDEKIEKMESLFLDKYANPFYFSDNIRIYFFSKNKDFDFVCYFYDWLIESSCYYLNEDYYFKFGLAELPFVYTNEDIYSFEKALELNLFTIEDFLESKFNIFEL